VRKADIVATLEAVVVQSQPIENGRLRYVQVGYLGGMFASLAARWDHFGISLCEQSLRRVYELAMSGPSTLPTAEARWHAWRLRAEWKEEVVALPLP
jgi:hypothetical protein